MAGSCVGEGTVGRSAGTSRRRSAPRSSGGARKRRVPPWSWATQRATASPTPVPPAPSVPNRSKTRSRSSGATPAPSSATSSHHPAPSAPPAIRTVVPAGAWRPALSSTLTRSCRSRAGSPGTTRSSPSSTTNDPGRPADVTCSTDSSTSRCSRTSCRSRSTTPASSRESWSRSSTRRPRRWAWTSAAPRWSASGLTTPSARFSRSAVIAVRGVRSSWDTVAMRSRRSRSTVARSSAIRLNAVASWPTSSVAKVRTRPE